MKWPHTNNRTRNPELFSEGTLACFAPGPTELIECRQGYVRPTSHVIGSDVIIPEADAR